MTPKNPWSFFLNFFWSNICTASMLSSEARLITALVCCSFLGIISTLTSQNSGSSRGWAFFWWLLSFWFALHPELPLQRDREILGIAISFNFLRRWKTQTYERHHVCKDHQPQLLLSISIWVVIYCICGIAYWLIASWVAWFDVSTFLFQKIIRGELTQANSNPSC